MILQFKYFHLFTFIYFFIFFPSWDCGGCGKSWQEGDRPPPALLAGACPSAVSCEKWDSISSLDHSGRFDTVGKLGSVLWVIWCCGQNPEVEGQRDLCIWVTPMKDFTHLSVIFVSLLWSLMKLRLAISIMLYGRKCHGLFWIFGFHTLCRNTVISGPSFGSSCLQRVGWKLPVNNMEGCWRRDWQAQRTAEISFS